jgi:predicted metal-dependent peptidase
MTDLNLQIDRVNSSLDRLCDRYKNLSDSIGYLQIKPCSESTPTAMTDGFCITFNPEHVDGLSQDQLDSLMMHEILHIIDWHFIGSEDKDPYLWNLSCDFRVNSILRRIGFTMKPMALDNERYDDMDQHQIYQDLSAMRQRIIDELDGALTKVTGKIKAIKGNISKEKQDE